MFQITYVKKEDIHTISVGGYQVEETMNKLKENGNVVLFLDDHYVGDL